VEPEIVNLVATADLGQPVDLIQVSMLPDIIFDQDIYGGRVAYFKSSDTFGKVSVFFSGKLISVGSRSEEQARHDLLLVRDFLVSHGIIESVELSPLTRNIVATLNLSVSIDLELMSTDVNVIYEPEQFPAAILRYNNPKSTFLIFHSGKIVISGVRSVKELYDSANYITTIVDNYV